MSNHSFRRRQDLARGNVTPIRPAGDVVARMVIEIRRNGQTSVIGPMGNKKLCMAILEDAANVVKAYNAESEKDEANPESAIVKPSSGIISLS
jgi:hypothetical protein